MPETEKYKFLVFYSHFLIICFSMKTPFFIMLWIDVCNKKTGLLLWIKCSNLCRTKRWSECVDVVVTVAVNRLHICFLAYCLLFAASCLYVVLMNIVSIVCHDSFSLCAWCLVCVCSMHDGNGNRKWFVGRDVDMWRQKNKKPLKMPTQ